MTRILISDDRVRQENSFHFRRFRLLYTAASFAVNFSLTMDILEAIEKRHSYREKYRNDPVPEEHLRRIVTAGIVAPSGGNGQTTEFVIVNDPKMRDDLAEIMGSIMCRTAPAIIVCVTEHREIYPGMAFEIEDCSAAVENMLLAITGLGYASVWLDGVLRNENRAARIAQLLGIPENRTVRVILPVGVPLAPGAHKEKLAFDKRAWFNSYGG